MVKHYVVVLEWATNDDAGVIIVGVEHTFYKAKESLDHLVIEERKIAAENGWEVFEDNDYVFDAGESGYYAAEHTKAYIQGVP